MYPTDAHTCATCAHRATQALTIGNRQLFTCAKNALDGDVPGTWTLVSLESNCTAYAGEWEPSAEYLAECDDITQLRRNPAAYYGVRQGCDFPATLAM